MDIADIVEKAARWAGFRYGIDPKEVLGAAWEGAERARKWLEEIFQVSPALSKWEAAYVKQAARHAAIDQARIITTGKKNRVRPPIPDLRGVSSGMGLMWDHRDPSPPPDEVVASKEYGLVDMIESLMKRSKVTELEKEAARLHWFDGEDYEVVAEKMGKTEDACRRLVAKAKKKVLSIVSEEDLCE